MEVTEAGLIAALWVVGIYAAVLTVGVGIGAAVVFVVS